jgi:hypothetical protein
MYKLYEKNTIKSDKIETIIKSALLSPFLEE